MKIHDWSRYGVDPNQLFDVALADLIGKHPNGISRKDVEQFAQDWITAKLIEWQTASWVSIWSRSDRPQQILGFVGAYKEHVAKCN